MRTPRGRHRRPSARPATIVTVGAGALLLAAAVPAGSVERAPAAPVSATADPGESLALLSEIIDQLGTEHPSAVVDGVKERLRALEPKVRQITDQAGEKADRVKTDLRELRDQLRGGDAANVEAVYERVIGILK